MNKPLVSICIPTYNNPLSVKRCIESVLFQTYPAIEIIVTDDSSNNATSELIANEFTNANIQYFKNEKALGSPANWNAAVKKASGKYIKILHHDDWFAIPDAVASFVFTAEENEQQKALIFCNSVNVYSTTEQKELKPSSAFLKQVKQNPDTLFYSNHIGSPSICFFEKELFCEFDVQSRWYVDVIFYSEFLKKNGNQFIHIDKPLVNITAGNATQLTQTIPGLEKFSEALYCFKKYINLEQASQTLVFKITFIELLKRFKISDTDWQGFSFTEQEQQIVKPLYRISKIPLPRLLFTLVRRLLVNI